MRSKSDRDSTRVWLTRGVKLAIVAAIFWGVHRSAESAWRELRAELAKSNEHGWAIAPSGICWLVASTLLYLAAFVPSAWYWRFILTRLGETPGVGESLRAYYIGHLGKYVPGKAMVVILRVGLLSRSRSKMATATASVFYETLLLMAIGASIAGAVLAFRPEESGYLAWIAAGMSIVAGAPTWPGIFRRLFRLATFGKLDPETFARLDRLGPAEWGIGWLALSCGWLLLGASLWSVLLALGHSPSDSIVAEILLCTAAAALSIVAGFVSFIPGGFVVRELVLVPMLAPLVGEGPALVAAIASRLVAMVAESVVSGILYPLRGLARDSREESLARPSQPTPSPPSGPEPPSS